MLDDLHPGDRLFAVDVHDVTYEPADPDREDELRASLPGPGELPDDADDMLVTTSMKLPVGTRRRLKQYADAHGTTASELVREWIEMHLAHTDRTISLADAIRVLSSLPPPRF